ncbi:hypothetical protein SAMN05428988_4093 [Chitinophaga sp. YR573]|uniref:hypothetical protein n=1 Tax=Chitinophaga sp. YR573 TaxID=1881040 RepID=UPI0008C45304|nr:hypothetical protein [Chitinophaga sp. YR573]SEW29599.1 hypothetical protein SAMN05428988_4093 [Chitinophaga sp. YR573]
MTREQELIAAIKEADLNNVERLIKEGADLNYYERVYHVRYCIRCYLTVRNANRSLINQTLPD